MYHIQCKTWACRDEDRRMYHRCTCPHSHTHVRTHSYIRTLVYTHTHSSPRSQAKAAIAYRYSGEEELDKEEQAKKDEEVLAAYLGEEVEEEKAFSSESEYGMSSTVRAESEYGIL